MLSEISQRRQAECDLWWDFAGRGSVMERLAVAHLVSVHFWGKLTQPDMFTNHHPHPHWATPCGDFLSWKYLLIDITWLLLHHILFGLNIPRKELLNPSVLIKFRWHLRPSSKTFINLCKAHLCQLCAMFIGFNFRNVLKILAPTPRGPSILTYIFQLTHTHKTS